MTTAKQAASTATAVPKLTTQQPGSNVLTATWKAAGNTAIALQTITAATIPLTRSAEKWALTAEVYSDISLLKAQQKLQELA